MPLGIYTRTKKHNENIARALKGKKLSPEHNENQRLGHLGKSKGYVSTKGYKTLYLNGKQMREHHLVYCLHFGLSRIPKDCVVHHIDGNKLNNNVDNLLLMSIAEHTKLHMLSNTKDKAGEE